MTILRHRLTIHPAQTGDLEGVVEIYNAGVAERVATFETAPCTIEAATARRSSRTIRRSTR